jgi:hypothetical protein
MVFSDLWAGRAVKTTLAPKFGSVAQRWGRAGLGKGGTGWNPGPPFPPLNPPPLPPPFLLPSPWPWDGGGQGVLATCHGGPRGLTSRPASRGHDRWGGLLGRRALPAAMVGGGRPWPPPPQGQGEERRKEGRRGRGVTGGKGGPGFHPAPPFPRLALPHL